jgi:hypothetical protein
MRDWSAATSFVAIQREASYIREPEIDRLIVATLSPVLSYGGAFSDPRVI